jgi:hypothetical protein
MPILYVHGVNVRSRDGFQAVEPLLRRYLAPALADEPESVLIEDVYWGELAFDPAFDGISRPRSRITGMGGADEQPTPAEAAIGAVSLPEGVRRLAESPPASATSGELTAGGAPATSAASMPARLGDFGPDELADLLAAAVLESVDDVAEQSRLILAADAVAHDPATAARLARAGGPDAQLDALIDDVRRQAAVESALVAAGAFDWVPRLRDRIAESLDRAQSLPTWAVSIALAEFRAPLNHVVSRFLGDVFHYLDDRGTAEEPGPIPQLVLDKLRAAHRNKVERGGEPLVLFTHSMGGQLVYDAITHFVPAAPDLGELHVDFWCASASQVGFFEEARLFRASSKAHGPGNPVPFPPRHLGVWWNVWDYNDVLSFTAKDIFKGVDDGPFDSGLSLLEAHGGYPRRPSFYRAFRSKLDDAKTRNWRTG